MFYTIHANDDLIEDGAITRDLALRDPVKAIKEVSHDPTCRKEIALDDGRHLTAVQVQSEFLEMALAYYSSREIDPVTKDVLSMWQSALEALGYIE